MLVTNAMSIHAPDDAELRQAFALFSQTSEKLAETYLELQSHVGRLTSELAAANGYTQYSINYFERAGMELLDVPATPEEAIRIRVRCPVCAR